MNVPLSAASPAQRGAKLYANSDDEVAQSQHCVREMTNLCIGLIILYREEMAKEMSDLLSRWVVTLTFPSSQNDMKRKKINGKSLING